MAGKKKDPVDLCNEKLVIFLPKALRDAFSKKCYVHGLTMSAVIRGFMEDFILSNEKPHA